MSVELALQLKGEDGKGGDEMLLKAIVQESYGVHTGHSVAKAIADELLRREALATVSAETARRIPIDERYYIPRNEPWLPGEYIPRPWYEKDVEGDIDRGIDEIRLLERPIVHCLTTGAALKW